MSKLANTRHERTGILIFGTNPNLDNEQRERDGALICGPEWAIDDVEQAKVICEPGVTDEEYAAQCRQTRLLLGLLVMQNGERKARSG